LNPIDSHSISICSPVPVQSTYTSVDEFNSNHIINKLPSHLTSINDDIDTDDEMNNESDIIDNTHEREHEHEHEREHCNTDDYVSNTLLKQTNEQNEITNLIETNDLITLDRVLHRKGFCSMHQFCQDPLWRYDSKQIEQKNFEMEQIRIQYEKNNQDVIEMKYNLEQELENEIRGFGYYLTMRELNFLRKRYKQQILLETKKIMSRSNLGSNSQSTSNSTSTCSPIEFDPVSQRISTRKKKFINFENSLPDPVIHLMMSDQYSDPNDQTIFPDAFETFNNFFLLCTI
jgi:hypothetical protein